MFLPVPSIRNCPYRGDQKDVLEGPRVDLGLFDNDLELIPKDCLNIIWHSGLWRIDIDRQHLLLCPEPYVL